MKLHTTSSQTIVLTREELAIVLAYRGADDESREFIEVTARAMVREFPRERRLRLVAGSTLKINRR